MNIRDLYPAIESACHALNPIVDPALSTLVKAYGITQREASYLLAVPTFEPNPVSADILRIRSPYTSSELLDSILASLKEHGFLDLIEDGAYHINKVGLDLIKKLNHSIYDAISGIQTLAVTDLMDLASRLKVFSDACFSAPEPPGKWSILHSRRLDPGTRAPIMVRIDQFLTELCAFRDDAHLAAWQAYENDGHAWDILTLLWVEKELTMEMVNQSLSRRGNSLDQTRAAVETLLKKGWLAISEEKIHISAFGAEIRKIAEETTDRYYYAPFKQFSDQDLNLTLELINKHRRGIPSI